jgi:hypothetical protein
MTFNRFKAPRRDPAVCPDSGDTLDDHERPEGNVPRRPVPYVERVDCPGGCGWPLGLCACEPAAR